MLTAGYRGKPRYPAKHGIRPAGYRGLSVFATKNYMYKRACGVVVSVLAFSSEIRLEFDSRCRLYVKTD